MAVDGTVDGKADQLPQQVGITDCKRVFSSLPFDSGHGSLPGLLRRPAAFIAAMLPNLAVPERRFQLDMAVVPIGRSDAGPAGRGPLAARQAVNPRKG